MSRNLFDCACRLYRLARLVATPQRTQPASACFLGGTSSSSSCCLWSIHRLGQHSSNWLVTSQQGRDMSDNGTGSKFRIYTKTGDKGTAALYSGERRSKDDDVFHALGDVDELNSAIGVAQEFCTVDQEDLQQQLQVVMSRLLDVGSAVATPADTSSERKLARVQFPKESTAQIEAWLDAMDDQLPPLRNFILPSGGKAAAHLHLARSVCRRAERSVVPLVRGEAVDPEVGVYLNRLSDYLFTAARFAARQEGQPEVIYKKAT